MLNVTRAQRAACSAEVNDAKRQPGFSLELFDGPPSGGPGRRQQDDRQCLQPRMRASFQMGEELDVRQVDVIA